MEFYIYKLLYVSVDLKCFFGGGGGGGVEEFGIFFRLNFDIINIIMCLYIYVF